MVGGDLVNVSELAKLLSPDFGSSLTPGLPGNISIFDALPPEVVSNIQLLMTILKAAGIIFIIYMIFLIIKGIFNIRKGIKLNKMYHRINDIDRKVDVLLSNDKLKVKEKEVMVLKEKEKGFLKGLFKPRTERKLIVLKKEEKKEPEKKAKDNVGHKYKAKKDKKK